VEAAYVRAQFLCRKLGETPRLYQAMMGIGAYHFVRGEYRAAVLIGEQLLLLTEKHPDDGAQLEASLLLGVAKTYLGELEAALAPLERALDLYDVERHQSHNLLYMQDPAVAAGCFASVVSWLLGHRELALCHLREAHVLAEQQSNPHAIVLALTFQGMIAQLGGDLLGSREHAERGLELCAEFGFVFCGEILKIIWGVSRLQPGEIGARLEGHYVVAEPELGQQIGADALERVQLGQVRRELRAACAVA
jgi:predicted ATPase